MLDVSTVNKRKSSIVSTFSPSVYHEVIGLDTMILVLWSWFLSQPFHSPLSPSSRGCLVSSLLSTISGIICISEVIDIFPGNLDSSLWFIEPDILHDALCIYIMWCWRRLLRVPRTARRSNQKISPEYSLEGRTDAEAEAPTLWAPDAKNWLIWKDPDAGKDWRWEEKGTTEDEVVGWRHQLDGHEFEQAPGVGDGQGGLVCCNPWDGKELDTTEWLNWTLHII